MSIVDKSVDGDANTGDAGVVGHFDGKRTGLLISAKTQHRDITFEGGINQTFGLFDEGGRGFSASEIFDYRITPNAGNFPVFDLEVWVESRDL